MTIYILMLEYWSNPNYNTEVAGAYRNFEDAENARKLNQGGTPTYDIRYYIEEVELL